MSVTVIQTSVPSCDGCHSLWGVVYLPEGKPKGIIHVLHGMTEYIGRYELFLREMAEDGWISCGYDHLGHGHTVNDPAELGFIADRGGHDLLLRDVKNFSDAIREEYGSDLPYVLMGHSMGSFIARLAAATYVTPDALIVMGTGGPNPVAGAGLALCGIIKTCKGSHHVSPFLDRVAFGGYNAGFEDGKDHPQAWLTKNAEVREKYAADPLCTFKFTVSAMGDLIRLTRDCNRRSAMDALPAGMPVLLVSGKDDPVGDFGKGVETVRDHLVRTGRPVTCHLYDGYRHEILNDASHDAVVADIRAFLAGFTGGKA